MQTSPKNTRNRVIEAIDKLEFRVNRAAQIMQTKRSHMVDAILFNAGFNLFLHEMARLVQQDGYQFFISAVTENEFQHTLDSAASRFVDGLILTPNTVVPEDYDVLVNMCNGIPFVLVGAKLGAPVPSVLYDQQRGAQLAVQHLIDLGHTKIAEVTGVMTSNDGADRHEGWLATLRQNGLTPGPVVEGDFGIQGGYQAMNTLLDRSEEFTAVFVGNDSMTFGAHTALREHGLSVPDDVSIVGFDDLPEAAHFVPGLTTIRQDFKLLGHMAIEYLLSMIDNPNTAIHQRILQPELIVRGSTCPPTR